jgi:streptomycin 6-kinase
MTSHLEPPAHILAHFSINTPVFTDQSGIATIWKVQRSDGHPAALKCYLNGDMKNEAPGFAFLQSCAGQGAAQIYDVTPGAALIEWLGGTSLGDLSRNGQDALANRHLIKTACKIHTNTITAPPDLPHLNDWFSALHNGTVPADWSTTTQHNMQKARDLSEVLLANQTDLRPLHGDLHHDNIKRGTRGYRAFDAKGVIGDRAFELANAFKNPIGAEKTVRNPRRIKHLAQSWGQAFGVSPHHLLSWACAYCALSYTWHINDGDDPDTTMLNLLFEARDALSSEQ